MRPEICQKWEEALLSLKKAEELLGNNLLEEAEREAESSVVGAYSAIQSLSKDMDIPYLFERSNYF